MDGENIVMEFTEDHQQDFIPEGPSLVLNLDGYEGPIDLLLNLSRDQKVDLKEISILDLANQYLDFIKQARDLRLEVAADYLVMAAWLAYLKSKLLVPSDDDDAEEELSGEALADALAFQLKRLEAMQTATELLFKQPQLGKDVFARGHHEDNMDITISPIWQVDLYDLLTAYGAIAKRQEKLDYKPKAWPLMSMDEAYERLANMLGTLPRKNGDSVWAVLDSFIPENLIETLTQRSGRASMFTASLEMAKQGQIEIRQNGLFSPIYIKQKAGENEE